MIFVVGGGGGKLKDTDAVLIVTVPTGSTVTATKGGTTLTPTMWTTAADASLDCALFIIQAKNFDSVNAWIITATNGEYTASETVTVSAARQYDITLSYGHYIFKSGSGTVMRTTTATADNTTQWDITNERMYVKGADSWGGRGVQTASKIDLSNYTKIIVDGYRTSPGGSSPRTASFITDKKIVSDGTDGGAAIDEERIAYVDLPTSRGTVELDVSSYNTSHYVTIGGCYTMYIYNWWLE